MKTPTRRIIIFGFAISLALITQLFIFFRAYRQKSLISEKILVETERLKSLEKTKRDLQLVSKRILKLEKTHSDELGSLKENKLESLFHASRLVRKHHLILLKSMVDDNHSIKITLSGTLQNFLGFLQEFLKSEKVFQLRNISITTNPSLTFEIEWEPPGDR